MLNKVVLIGRLANDPEMRYTSGGNAVCNFDLAVERDYTNQDGNKEVDFIKMQAWRKLAETIANHLGKGRLAAVEGRLQVRQWQTKEGENRYTTEVVVEKVQFLDWPDDNKKKKSDSDQGQYIEEEIEVPF